MHSASTGQSATTGIPDGFAIGRPDPLQPSSRPIVKDITAARYMEHAAKINESFETNEVWFFPARTYNGEAVMRAWDNIAPPFGMPSLVEKYPEVFDGIGETELDEFYTSLQMHRTNTGMTITPESQGLVLRRKGASESARGRTCLLYTSPSPRD